MREGGCPFAPESPPPIAFSPSALSPSPSRARALSLCHALTAHASHAMPRAHAHPPHPSPLGVLLFCGSGCAFLIRQAQSQINKSAQEMLVVSMDTQNQVASLWAVQCSALACSPAATSAMGSGFDSRREDGGSQSMRSSSIYCRLRGPF